MKIIKIKDSDPLTFEEWENGGDYDDEVNEAIDNFLYDDGEEVIKYWNEEMPEYAYDSVDEIKEDIETERNDIYNLTVGNKKLEEDLRLELESIYEKYHGMIKDDNEEGLTFQKWQEDDKYENERDEVVNNFLNQYGNELIKIWNKEVEETYRYYTVDRLKEDIKDGWNDIFNVTLGSDDLLKKLDLEFKKIYEKYHGPIKENENDKVDHSIFYTTGVDRNYFGRKFRHLDKDKIMEKDSKKIKNDYDEDYYDGDPKQDRFWEQAKDYAEDYYDEYLEWLENRDKKGYHLNNFYEGYIEDFMLNEAFDKNENLNINNENVKYLLDKKVNLPKTLDDYDNLDGYENFDLNVSIIKNMPPKLEKKWYDEGKKTFDPTDDDDFMQYIYDEQLEYDSYRKGDFDDSKKTKKDASEIDFDYLLSEESKAVQDYKDAIAKTSDKSALYVLSHILKEESHHIELLENLRKGKVEFEDSKDDDFDWGVKLVELSMDNIGDYETDGTPTHIYNIIDYNFFHQNYELLKSEIQKQMEHPEDMTEFEDEFYEFTDHDDLLDFVQNNYVLRRKYQDYIEQLNKKYGKFVREDQAEKTARKIIDKIKKDIKFRR